MNKILRILSAFVLVVFAHFVFASTVFMHTHELCDGGRITHSHPYIPSQGHSHTSAGAMSIAQLNMGAMTMEGTAGVDDTYVAEYQELLQRTAPGARPSETTYAQTYLRAPPVRA